ncbi:MAG TPA: hypothetical protein VIS96_10130 [Terrimicrobiaceae bacterium]
MPLTTDFPNYSSFALRGGECGNSARFPALSIVTAKKLDSLRQIEPASRLGIMTQAAGALHETKPKPSQEKGHFEVNRPGNVVSHEGCVPWIDRAIKLVTPYAGQITLRGDTDFSLTAELDRWDEQGSRPYRLIIVRKNISVQKGGSSSMRSVITRADRAHGQTRRLPHHEL